MKTRLLELIAEKTTPENVGQMQESVMNMLCNESQPMPLSEETICRTLEMDGEFFVLKMCYEDFEKELKEGKIKRKISQSLSIVASYEDAGDSLEEIETFVKYIHDLSEESQNVVFGIRRVERLSEYPVTILFGGILPINQLRMSIGEEVDSLIRSDPGYFLPRFKKVRSDLSEAIGFPILPLFPRVDPSLPPHRVKLVDPLENRLVSEFEVPPHVEKEGINIYLLKLFHIYRELATRMKKQFAETV
ncbi:hypothetical protein [Hydrogenimonas sp.]|uniref:hypothetical protein n=1 Tax=Hydrogenimonas sp. TaxID=2231112 RepID=UPI0026091B22|nr:hypothetical protein [Hydrogenimonas sp.]